MIVLQRRMDLDVNEDSLRLLVLDFLVGDLDEIRVVKDFGQCADQVSVGVLERSGAGMGMPGRFPGSK